MNFTTVNLNESDTYYAIWDMTPRRSLDYSLLNLWGWQDYFGLEWEFSDQLCWIRQNRPRPAYWAPLGAWDKVDWTKIFSFAKHPLEFIRVPEDLLRIWQAAVPEMLLFEEDRGQWEYLYKREDLVNLPGKHLHKKKTHCNNYVKAYGEPDYHFLDEAMVEDVLSLQDDWCQWHECEDSPSLRAENEAINRVFAHWDCFRGLYGGSIYADGRMIAFCLGEKLDDENLGVHYEKGLNGFTGIYQIINREFSRQAGAGFTYLNRAQDLDEEGLRQAKMSYRPANFLRKYKVRVGKP